MKKIEAIIKPFKFEEVKNALAEIGIKRMIATEVKGFDRQNGHTEFYRSREYTVDFLPNIKIELFVSDDQLDQTIRAISTPSMTGRDGGDEIFVSTIERASLIRASTMTGFAT